MTADPAPRRVRQALSSADRKAFIAFPFTRYAADPLWVPPLRLGLAAEFDPRRNAYLAHCDHALFLLETDSAGPSGPARRVTGRVAALVDRLALEAWGEPIGMFAYFECGDGDPAGAAALLDAARDWLVAQGMRKMRGPWSFVSQEWGLVVEGFSPRPVIMAPYVG